MTDFSQTPLLAAGPRTGYERAPRCVREHGLNLPMPG